MGELNGQTYLAEPVPKASAVPFPELEARGSRGSSLKSEHGLDRALADVQSSAPSSFAVAWTSASVLMMLRSTILDQVPELHGLVHNAGDIHPIKPLFGAETAGWTRSMMVNLVGVQHLRSHPVRRFRRTPYPCHHLQAALRFALASWSAYCTAKAGWTCGRAAWPRRCTTQHHGGLGRTWHRRYRDANGDSLSCTRRFPLLDNFVGYHENDLSDADTVAKALHGLITAHTEAQSGQRFDVRDL